MKKLRLAAAVAAVRNNSKQLAVSAVLGASVLSTGAFAAGTGPDYSSIGASLAVDSVVAALVSFATIKIGPNFTRWASNKIAAFF